METANNVILLNLSDEMLIKVAGKKNAVALQAKFQVLYVMMGSNSHLYMLKRMFQF